MITPSKISNYGIKIAKDGIKRNACQILSQKSVNMNKIRMNQAICLIDFLLR